MQVVKRDGRKEPVSFDKITSRISKLCYSFDPAHVAPSKVAQKVVQGVYDGVTTAALDDLAAEPAAYLTPQHPDYSRLASPIAASNLQKNTDASFSCVMDRLHAYKDPKPGEPAPQRCAADSFDVCTGSDRILGYHAWSSRLGSELSRRREFVRWMPVVLRGS